MHQLPPFQFSNICMLYQLIGIANSLPRPRESHVNRTVGTLLDALSSSSSEHAQELKYVIFDNPATASNLLYIVIHRSFREEANCFVWFCWKSIVCKNAYLTFGSPCFQSSKKWISFYRLLWCVFLSFAVPYIFPFQGDYENVTFNLTDPLYLSNVYFWSLNIFVMNIVFCVVLAPFSRLCAVLFR